MDPGEDLVDPFVDVVGVIVEQLDDHAVGFLLICKSICLIRIHMHSKGEILMDADDHVGVDQGPLVAPGQDEDGVVVFDTHLVSLGGGHVLIIFSYLENLEHQPWG